MEPVETLSIALTPEQSAALRAAVAGGEYATTGDAVSAAIRDWQARRQQDVLRLRALWDEGLASGPAGEVDFNSLREEARARLARR